ncbi:MAG: hypothetical protein QF535_20275 [Anaerolineales bacterium]|nr:hypothetical protein [Anaerolineales bacterium]
MDNKGAIPGYPDLDLADLSEVKIIDAMGVLRDGFLLVDAKPDRLGLVTILDPVNNRILKPHPDRIVDDTKNVGSMAIIDNGQTIAACPTCGEICEVIDDVGTCTCGQFAIVGTIEGVTKSTPPATKKTVAAVDIKSLSSGIETWVRTDVPFNGKTQVTAISMRVETRYISFNLYNGSFGKKGIIPPIEALRNGDQIGYTIKNLEKWRKKLQVKGYELLE